MSNKISDLWFYKQIISKNEIFLHDNRFDSFNPGEVCNCKLKEFNFVNGHFPQALLTNATTNCISATSLSVDLLESFYEHPIGETNVTESYSIKPMLDQCSHNILAKIRESQKSLFESNVGAVSRLHELRLTVQVELGKVFILVQNIASLNWKIVGTVDLSINEISLRLLTLLSSIEFAIVEKNTAQEIDVLKNLDNDFINVGESLFSLIEFIYNLTYGQNRTSGLVVNLEQILQTILLTIKGFINLCKELMVRAELNVSLIIINLCKDVEIACNLINQGESAISVGLNLSLQLNIDVKTDVLIKVFENELNNTVININQLCAIFDGNRISKSTIQNLRTNMVIMVSAMRKIIEIFQRVEITKSKDYNMLISTRNVLTSMNLLIDYVTNIFTTIRAVDNIHLHDSTIKFRNILMDITGNYESLIDDVYRMSVSYGVRVFGTTNSSVNLSDQLKDIHQKLVEVALSLHQLTKSILNVIEITLRSTVVTARILSNKCLTTVNRFITDITTMLHDVDEVNIYNGIYRLYFGAGPSEVGELSVCAVRFAIIVETTRNYSVKLNSAMEILKRKVDCSR